jgi:transposase
MNYQEAIIESVDYLGELERQISDAKCRDRVRFIRLLKSGQASSQRQAGALIGIGERYSQRLWKRYTTEGIAAISQVQYKGYCGKLSAEAKAQLQKHLQTDQVESLQDAQAYLQQQLGVQYKSLSGVSYVFSRMKIKLKTGRPSHVQKDPEAVEHFKKKSFRP